MDLDPLLILEKVRAVPDAHRRFLEPAESAQRKYGISPELLESLLSKGLPSARRNDGLFFDPFDLSNISLHLRLPSVQRMAMRSWSRTLELAGSGTGHEAVIDLDPVAPATPAQQRSLSLDLSPPDESALPDLATLIGTVSKQLFFMLPEACRWNTGFLIEHGISECGGASKLLVGAAREAGMKARQCFGILIAAPYSTGHFWAEIKAGNSWVAIDPLLIKLLHQTTRLNPDKWPLHRSPGAAFHRLMTIEEYDASGAPILHGYADVPYLSNLVLVRGNLITPLSLSTTIFPKTAHALQDGRILA